MAKAIVYFGSKGAGVEFFREIQQRVDFDLIVTNQKNTLNVDVRSSLLVLKISDNFVGYVYQYFFQSRRMRKLLFKELMDKNIRTLFVPMASPFDLKLILKAQNYGIKVVYILHDSKRHPGDIWPRSYHIRQMIENADRLICLSNFVKDEVLKKNKQNIKSIRVASHPVLNLRTGAINENGIQNLPEEYLLLIGRIRKYKNFENFVKAWQESGRKENIVVAGSGRLRLKKSRFPNYQFINKWLTNDEIISLIKGSKIVAFPYLEGSQSGLIPIVKEQKKIILISALPGLMEQVSEYKNTYILENNFTNLKTLKFTDKLNEQQDLRTDLTRNSESDWQLLAATVEELTS